MPALVQKSFTVTILTTVFTSLSLALILFFGGTTLESRDTRIMYQNTAVQVDKIIANQASFDFKIDAMMVFISENRTDLRVVETDLKYCKESIANCKAQH